VTDGVHPTVHPMQLPRRDPPPHATRAEAELLQLLERDDTVLLQSERRNLLVPRDPVTFRHYLARNVTGSDRKSTRLNSSH